MKTIYDLSRVIAKGLTFEKNFEDWCKNAIERSESEKKATLEGTIVSVVYDLVNRGLFEVEEVLKGKKQLDSMLPLTVFGID